MTGVDKFIRVIAWFCSYAALYDSMTGHDARAAYDIGFAVWFYLISEKK
jgi:hypothetical protein